MTSTHLSSHDFGSNVGPAATHNRPESLLDGNGRGIMTGMLKMQFAEMEELKEYSKGSASVVTIGGAEVYRYVFEPGWRYVEHAAPIEGTDSCPAPHILCTVSGRLGVKMMDDGSIEEVGEGECIVLPPGHDAWTIGDIPYICIDLGPQLYEHLVGGPDAQE
jgi:hypothetical protein